MKTKKEYGLYWIYKKTNSPKFLLIHALLVIISTTLTVSMAYFLKVFVDIANGDSDKSLVATGVSALIVVLIGGIITVISSIVAKYTFGKTERGLRAEVMDIVLSRRIMDIRKKHTGELLTKLTDDVRAVSNCFVLIINSMVGGIVSALFAIVAMFVLNWKMTLIMLILMPILMAMIAIISPFMQKASKIDKNNDELTRSMMQENLSRIILIKTYFMRTKIGTKVRDLYSAKLKSGVKLGIWEGSILFFGVFISMAMFMITLGVGAHFVRTGETTVGNLVAMVQLLTYIINPINKLSETIPLITQATASSARIGELYAFPADEEISMSSAVEATELTAENVNFSYDSEEGEDSYVLKDITASFSKGCVTGIVGESGSGKSTLLKLLIGLYAPQQGTVKLKHKSGVLTGEEIMPQIAYVPPSDYLFSGTVLENIVMAEDEPDLDEVEEALSGANILEFVESMSDKLDTLLGESGASVSSGQAQRLAIARAIYKKSPIVVFDEPTANLDVDSIEKFQATIKLIAKNKICIIVTHDVPTITVCDKVYMIEQGNISEKNAEEKIVLA